MLWIKALHIISVICWFSGLFYLPRLFVYHAMSEDPISQERFKLMQSKLYFAITTPAAVASVIFGLWMLSLNWPYYISSLWLQIKLLLVLVLIGYHLMCGHLMQEFKLDRNKHSHAFYRWFNEFPVLLLVAIVILAVVKPL